VKARANTRITILRGSTSDSFGDPKDLPKTILTGVTASIIERNKTTTNPDDGNIRTVRTYTCRIPAGTPLRTGDRIKDEKTGAIYVFDSFTTATNPVRGADIRLDLRRIT
jgi:hypothetical protein